MNQKIDSTPDENRRRAERLPLPIPAYVKGRDTSGEDFLELGQIRDISALGAGVLCSRVVKVGDSILLSIPTPTIEPVGPSASSKMQAFVRRINKMDRLYFLGVELANPLS